VSIAGVLRPGSSLRAARSALRLLIAVALVATQFVLLAGQAAAVAPTVTVTSSPSPTSVPEPGGTVIYTIGVTNTAEEDVTLTSLSSSTFGDLLDTGNSAVSDNTCPVQPAAIAATATFSCSFGAELTGGPGDPNHVSTVTAEVQNAGLETGSGFADATVSFTDVLPAISVAKDASAPWVAPPSGTIMFSVTVTNESTAEGVTLDSLSDNVFGDLLDASNPAVASNTCPSQSTTIAASGIFSCSFDAVLVGEAGDPDHVNTVSATASDDETNSVAAGDSATVAFVDGSLSITVAKTPSVSAVPDSGPLLESGTPVTFTVEVVNTSAIGVDLVSLADSVFGDLLDSGNTVVEANTCHAQAAAIAPGAAFTCEFTAELIGNTGDPNHVKKVTATVQDAELNQATGDAEATVSYGVLAALSGFVWEDVNGDGVADPDESGVPGIQIVITDTSGVESTAVTGADGNWAVDVAVGAASLSVDETSLPPGAVLTTGNATQTVDVIEDGVTAASIGYTLGDPAALSGTVFLDLDGDGVQTHPEPGIEGVTVFLYDGEGGLVTSIETDADGDFAFDEVEPGEYDVDIDAADLPAGIVVAADARAIDPGEQKVENFAVEGTGSIGSRVWLDADGNGVFDPDEDPLQNVAVDLIWAGFDGEFGTGDDWVFEPAVTDATGAWSFEDLPPGRYAGAVDTDTVGEGMEASTPLSFEVDLAADEDHVSDDLGFEPGDDPLPQTGLGAIGIGFLGFMSLMLGGALIVTARVVEARRRRLLLSRLFWR
jgi:hypothetical protein